MLASSGVKVIGDIELTKSNLLNIGWKEVNIGTAPMINHSVTRDVFAKRKQYGIKPFIASTIHRVMGDTIGSIVTCVNDMDIEYNLWDKEQAIVLLSRISFCKDITFVGDRNVTSRTLRELIQGQNYYSKYMRRFLRALNTRTTLSLNDDFISYTAHPFSPEDIELPHTTSGFVYLLISLKDSNTTYVGETFNLRRRLKEHNEGYGSKQTLSPNLRPWGLYAYISGYQGNKDLMMSNEGQWSGMSRRYNMPYRPQNMLRYGKTIVSHHNNNNLPKLLFVQAGKV